MSEPCHDKISFYRKICFNNSKILDETIKKLKYSLNESKIFLEKYNKSQEKESLNKKLLAKSQKDDTLPIIDSSTAQTSPNIQNSGSEIKNAKGGLIQNKKKEKKVSIITPDEEMLKKIKKGNTLKGFELTCIPPSDKEAKLIHSRVFGKHYENLKTKESEVFIREQLTGRNLVIEKQITQMQTKIHFIKEIYNYLYPKVMLEKIKTIKNDIKSVQSKDRIFDDNKVLNTEFTLYSPVKTTDSNAKKKSPLKTSVLYSNTNFQKYKNFKRMLEKNQKKANYFS